MSRERLCKYCGGWHDLEAWPHNCRDPEPWGASRTLTRPYVVSDTMPDAVQSPADGRFYDSKSALRSTYRPSGNPDGERYIEVGTDPQRLKPGTKPKPDRKQIRDAVEKARARFDRGERVQPSA